MERPGLTLVELLIVVCIILVLIGVSLNGVSLVREAAKRTECASNQRQIILAMMVYHEDYAGRWPFLGANEGGEVYDIIRDPEHGRMSHPITGRSPSRLLYGGYNSPHTAIASLELLAAWADGELALRLFRCPSSGTGPGLPPNQGLLTHDGSEPAWSELADSAYAYDFAAPARSASVRAILADRPIAHDEMSHGTFAVVAMADARVKTVKRLDNGGQGCYYRDWNHTFDWSQIRVINPEVEDDNIYDPIGDGLFVPPPDPAPHRILDPSPIRAWLR
jgi:hypothetical protein